MTANIYKNNMKACLCGLFLYKNVTCWFKTWPMWLQFCDRNLWPRLHY